MAVRKTGNITMSYPSIKTPKEELSQNRKARLIDCAKTLIKNIFQIYLTPTEIDMDQFVRGNWVTSGKLYTGSRTQGV